MMPAQSGTDAGIWTVPGHPPLIEYSRHVLADIVAHVCDAYESYLGGGYEVGGVLYGTRDRFHLRIQAFRKLEIRPPRPSFVLSESDSRRLDELIEAGRSDPALEGMMPLGWYHSHTRSEVFLSEGDLEVYSRHFPEPWHVAMVLHPSEFEPVRIGFFFRESDGFIRTDQSYQEFAVDAPPRTRLLRKSPPWKLDSDGQPEEAPLEIASPPSTEDYELAPEPSKPPVRQRARWWALALLAFLALVAAGYSIWTLRQPAADLGLRASAIANELHIEWNGASTAIRDAERTELVVTEAGKPQQISLKQKQAAHIYKPRTSRVDIILRTVAGWGQSSEERLTFLYHPSLNQPLPELQQARQAESELSSEVQGLRENLDRQRKETQRLESRIAEIRQQRENAEQARRQDELMRLEAKKVEAANRRDAALRRLSQPVKAAAPKDLPAAPEIAMRTPPRSAQGQAPVMQPTIPPPPPPVPAATTQPPPPATANPASATTPGGTNRLSPSLVSPTPASGAAPAVPSPIPAAAPKPRPAAPTSGRLLWVGDLPKGSELSIQGRKPSRGSILSGELPPGPVRIGAYPAELGNSNLRVFTTNPALAAKPRIEAPSVSNGWNTTEYVYDPKSVNQVIVERTPGTDTRSNLTLRAGSRKVSVIVIEWQVANP
ncbi:MAG: hypothetical protein JNL98_12470 [Bryobacterales bacterium]|nr:hypothetical protein [Bryobacterales bacterium]